MKIKQTADNNIARKIKLSSGEATCGAPRAQAQVITVRPEAQVTPIKGARPEAQVVPLGEARPEAQVIVIRSFDRAERPEAQVVPMREALKDLF